MPIYIEYSNTLFLISKNEDIQVSKLYYTTKIKNYHVRYICVSICMYICLLERTGLPLHQKINLSMPDTTNSIIEQQEVVNPCHEYYKGRWPTANNPTPRVTRLVL